MDSGRGTGIATGLPPSYKAIPITANATDPLQVCVIVSEQADPVAGHLVLLRDHLDARVYLGCVRDSGGVIHRWVELWMQHLDQIVRSPRTCQQALSNALLDRQWGSRFEQMRAIDPDRVLETGWEHRWPLPAWLDVEAGTLVHLQDEKSGQLWELCRDDALLAKSDLPAYSTSLDRFLWVPSLGDASPLVAATAHTTISGGVIPLASIVGELALTPLNPGAGLLLVRSFAPISWESFIDLLGGKPWPGTKHGGTTLRCGVPDGNLPRDPDHHQSSDGRLFLGAHGRSGWVVESFHLRLNLLATALRSVRSLAARTQQPLLNLRSESFQVDIGPSGSVLPYLWTARAILADPGDAVAVPIPSTQERYFLSGRSHGPSIFRPDSGDATISGRGVVRIRDVISEERAGTVIEGTLSTSERLRLESHDVIVLWMNLQGQRVDLYGMPDADAAMGQRELRFRTLRQQFPDKTAASLTAAVGVSFPETPFETLPLLSTPYDLYAMAVLFVRTLLVNPQNTLAKALDDMLVLARQVGGEADAKIELGVRIRGVFDSNPRWLESLGPHRLVSEAIKPEEAFDLIPQDLWWDTLGMIVRMFPGIGRDSSCSSYGDAPANGAHRAFDPAMENLEHLLMLTRSLIVVDWRFNREVNRIIRDFQSGA